MKIEEIVDKLQKLRFEAENHLKKKRLEIGFADKPTESRYISSTRWDLENAIVMAEKELTRIDENLKEVERLANRKITDNNSVGLGSIISLRINNKLYEFFITEAAEDMKIGLLPKISKIGKLIWGRKEDEEIDYETETGKQKIEIVAINKYV